MSVAEMTSTTLRNITIYHLSHDFLFREIETGKTEEVCRLFLIGVKGVERFTATGLNFLQVFYSGELLR